MAGAPEDSGSECEDTLPSPTPSKESKVEADKVSSFSETNDEVPPEKPLEDQVNSPVGGLSVTPVQIQDKSSSQTSLRHETAEAEKTPNESVKIEDDIFLPAKSQTSIRHESASTPMEHLSETPVKNTEQSPRTSPIEKLDKTDEDGDQLDDYMFDDLENEGEFDTANENITPAEAVNKSPRPSSGNDEPEEEQDLNENDTKGNYEPEEDDLNKYDTNVKDELEEEEDLNEYDTYDGPDHKARVILPITREDTNDTMNSENLTMCKSPLDIDDG